jgi:preprotein translocase subunit SecA
MLTSTEKILSVVALALIVAVGFSLLQYNSAMDEMTQLRQEQVEHVDMVNQEFKQRVKAVELENIGQGKEIKRGQDRITDNTKLIYTKADSLGSLIDDLAYEIKRVDRDLTKKIKNVQRDLEGLEDNFDSEKRRTRRDLSDIKKQLKKLDAAVFPPPEEEGEKKE